MAASATFNVEVKANGLALTRKQLDDLGFAVKQTSASTRDGAKASQDLFDTQNKGIIGTANSTKSFSKLAETIGGSSGVVAAYATLAANTFALTAAFNALKQAAQLDQIFRGLEASGARTGQTLTVAASHLQEITGYAISAKQALQSTAQVMSGGFNTKDLARLGQVAKDASFALGRDMTDSLDRLTRGVVKLEPELLDELGIMTKLTDSTNAYAQQNGKSATSLTNFQKRQGFLNAVVAEATLKFGGLSEAAGNSRVYDQLAATFENLKNSVLGTINSAIVPFLNILSTSPAALGGAAILFAGTISKQLLPGLADLAEKTARVVASSRESAQAKLKDVEATQAQIAATKELVSAEAAAVAEQRASRINTIRASSDQIAPVGYNRLVPSILEGEVGAAEKGQLALQKSLTAQIKNLNAIRDSGDIAAIENKKELLNDLVIELRDIDQLIAAEKTLAQAQAAAAATNTISVQELVIQQHLYNQSINETAALEQAGAAVAAASQGKIELAIKGTIGTIVFYKEALLDAQRAAIELASADLAAAAAAEKLATATKAQSVISNPIVGPANKAYYDSIEAEASAKTNYANNVTRGAFSQLDKETLTLGNKFKLLGVAGSTAARVVGSAFLNAIPAIGTAVFAIGLLQEAYEYFKSDSAKAAEKAMEDLGKIIADTSAKIEAFSKAQQSTAQVGLRTAQQLTIQANAVTELRDAYAEATKARQDYEKQKSEGGVAGLVSRLNPFDQNSESSYSTGLARNSSALKLLTSNEVNTRNSSSASDTVVKATQAIAKFQDLAPTATDSALKLYGGINKIGQLDTDAKIRTLGAVIDKVGKQFESNADLVASLTDALKNANLELGNFALASLPTTPFTAASKSLDTVTQSISNINRAVESGQASISDWVKVLDQAGPNITNFLTPDQNKILQSVRAMDTIKQSLEAQKRDQGDLSDSENAKLAHATAYLAANKNIYSVIQQQLETTSDLFRTAQKQSILNTQQLAVLQSIASSNQANYAATGAGELARVKNLNEQIRLQQSTLETQAKILEAQLAVNEAKVEEYRLQSGINSAKEKDNLLTEKASLLAQAQTDLAKARSTGDIRYQQRSVVETQSAGIIQGQIDNYNAANDQAKQNELQQLAIKSVLLQIEALQRTITTDAQATAQATKLDISFLTQKLTSLQGQRTAYQANYDLAIKIDRLINGTTDNISNAVADLAEARNRTNQSIADKYSGSSADLENQIAQAKADGAKTDTDTASASAARINQLEDQLSTLNQMRDVEQEQADLTYKLGVYEKALFDTRTDGLTQQQTALGYIQKQVDAQKDLSDAQQEGIKQRLTLNQRLNGTGNSTGFQEGLEIKAAQEAYRIAVQQAEIKKASIDAEYALLQAQRDMMKEQILDRRNVLADLQRTDNSPALQARIDQLDATVNNLNRVDVAAGREASKAAIEQGVENARTALRSALVSDTGDANDMGSRLAGIRYKYSATNSASNTLNSKIPAQQVDAISNPGRVIDDNFKKIADTAKDNAARVQEKIVDVINLLKTIAENTKPSVGGSFVDSSALTGNVKKAVDYFSSQGYSREVVAGIVGNLQTESFKGLKTDANNGSHVGIAQWDENRAKKFFEQFGHSVTSGSIDEQLKFVADELKNNPSLDKILRAATTFADAAKIFQDKYEVASGQGNATRVANASDIYKATSGTPKTITAANDNATNYPDMVVTAKSKAPRVTGLPTADDKLSLANIDLKTPNIAATVDQSVKGTELLKASFDSLGASTSGLVDILGKMGVEGGPLSALVAGFQGLSDTTVNFVKKISSKDSNFGDVFQAGAAVAIGALSAIQSALSATATQQEASIDAQITAEQNRDGKSAESLAKIDALNKKKDQIAKKSFDTNKKLMMAQTVIATAAAVAGMLAQSLVLGPAAIPLAVAIGALGLAELAIIAGTNYQSTGSTSSAISAPSTLSVGQQGSSVDLSKQNTNVGGEVGYLRGTPGTGSNASNYNVVNSAYGGALDRGYGSTAYQVGEKGPEILTADTPINITPMNDNSKQSPMAATINIHALDSSGVADILHSQRGNIISMLREAANANGQTFLEDVDTNVYTRPNISRL